jgi:phosphatidylglycerophosphatase A
VPRAFDRLIATGGHVGYFPIAPGTAGTFLAAALYWLLRLDLPLAGGACILLFLLAGIPASSRMEAHLGPDPPQVVVDEMVGFWIAMFALPRGLALVAVGFLVFRIFDIFKPFPVRRAERLPGGWGIMTDDVISGIYTNLVLRLILVLRG